MNPTNYTFPLPDLEKHKLEQVESDMQATSEGSLHAVGNLMAMLVVCVAGVVVGCWLSNRRK